MFDLKFKKTFSFQNLNNLLLLLLLIYLASFIRSFFNDFVKTQSILHKF